MNYGVQQVIYEKSCTWSRKLADYPYAKVSQRLNRVLA